jgi:ferrochelatase
VGCEHYDVVWQSRSGPPHVAWLAPDIVDHLTALADKDVDAVVVCPVGFVSDHLEVVWDLDNDARRRAGELGMAFARAATPGTDPRFVDLIVELVREQVDSAAGTPATRLGCEPRYGSADDGAPCAPGCCAALR